MIASVKGNMQTRVTIHESGIPRAACLSHIRLDAHRCSDRDIVDRVLAACSLEFTNLRANHVVYRIENGNAATSLQIGKQLEFRLRVILVRFVPCKMIGGDTEYDSHIGSEVDRGGELV